ncbi:MAG: hypothetical protein M3451_00320, partial [Chloroflexota bacterium]|nr:hypothetical protein [Chloroflexota bacterium]
MAGQQIERDTTKAPSIRPTVESTPVPGEQSGSEQPLSRLSDGKAARPRSLWTDAWRRLTRNRLSVMGLAVVVTFTLLALLAPLLAPYG